MLQIHPTLFPTSLSQAFIFTDLHYHPYAAPSEGVERVKEGENDSHARNEQPCHLECKADMGTITRIIYNAGKLSLWNTNKSPFLEDNHLQWQHLQPSPGSQKDFILNAWDLVCLVLNPRAGKNLVFIGKFHVYMQHPSSSIQLIECSRHLSPPPHHSHLLPNNFFQIFKMGEEKTELEKI